jgi:hypothetical protein
LNSGKIAYKDVDEATFNQWISDGYLTPTPNNLVESVDDVSEHTVMYRGFDSSHSHDGSAFNQLACPDPAMWVTPDIHYAIMYASHAGKNGQVARISIDDSKVSFADMDDLESIGIHSENLIDVGDPDDVQKILEMGKNVTANYLDEEGYCLLDENLIDDIHVMTPDELANSNVDMDELEYLDCDEWYKDYIGNRGKTLVEMVVYKKGHKNSKGEAAPWTIVSHETGKILSSHKSKSAAEEHLRQMEYYKHKKVPQTEGIKDWALAGALALSPLGAVDADAAPAQKKEIVEVPVVKDYSTLEFQNNVQYKLTGDQYRKLRACNNLPADYIVPKAEKKVDTTKTAAKNEKKSDSSVVHDDIYDVGNKIGSKAKSAWNGIKSFGKGIMNGWNGTNESVGDFSRWINERPKTPVVEAVIKLYESSK